MEEPKQRPRSGNNLGYVGVSEELTSGLVHKELKGNKKQVSQSHQCPCVPEEGPWHLSWR